MFRAVAAIWMLTATAVIAADALPPSCAGADRAKAEYIKRAGRSPVAIQDRLFGSGDDLATITAQRETIAESQMNTLARMCVGDLLADRRYEDAVGQALRYGLTKDASALQSKVDALKAKTPP
ncbi:hypothetical protein [Phenylobacterium sp.]|uniref:hypothetical protein n=1 Tax=Phenylobacterium sp. TaxID=1871053 RepID=UPI00374CB7E4